MNLIYIVDRLSPPYDEGVKNIVRHLVLESSRQCNVTLLTDTATGIVPETIRLPLGRSFFSNRLLSFLRRNCADLILYIPHGSLTTASYFRLWMLRLASPSRRTAIVGLQQRPLTRVGRRLLALAAPAAVVVLSDMMRSRLAGTAFPVVCFTPGVDLERFAPMPPTTKSAMRKQYGFVEGDFVVLHVGHLKASRNLGMLLDATDQIRARLLIVASSTYEHQEDPALCRRLQESGALILREEIPDIPLLYGLADCYAFPVLDESGATEMPLSVLEAMATNIPVVTTPHGALSQYFIENAPAGFSYASDRESFSAMLAAARSLSACSTRKMVEHLAWTTTVSTFLRTMGKVARQ